MSPSIATCRSEISRPRIARNVAVALGVDRDRASFIDAVSADERGKYHDVCAAERNVHFRHKSIAVDLQILICARRGWIERIRRERIAAFSRQVDCAARVHSHASHLIG
jgi:hypothetical protein